MNSDILKFAKGFVNEILEKEDWFKSAAADGGCDLLLLTGSSVESANDELSDVDFFLVCKYETQRKHNLKPVRLYDYKGKEVEVSILSTEKLFASQLHKGEIHWWHHTYVIKSYNKEAEKALLRASSLTRDELLDRLWTNLIYFEINSIDIEKQIQRNESVSIRILFNENVKMVIDSALASVGEFPSWKQSGRVLKEKNKGLYDKIKVVQQWNDHNEILEKNKELKQYLVRTLLSNGFSEEEINNWEDCNLTRVIFQYQ